MQSTGIASSIHALSLSLSLSLPLFSSHSLPPSLPIFVINSIIIIHRADLVGRMQTAEKISQLGNTAPAVDRLKIPAYQWWSEALHGIAHSPGVNFGGHVCCM